MIIESKSQFYLGPTVDLHTHPHLKSYMFSRSMNKKKFLSRLFKYTFWPFSHRVSLSNLEHHMDVSLATTYVLEREWLDDVPLIKFLSKLSPRFRQKILDPTYFQVTLDMMQHLEDSVKEYEGVSIARNKHHLVSKVNYGDSCVVHSVEGAHSLIGDGGPGDQKEIISNLRQLWEMGCAYLTLAHFYPNPAVESCVFPYPEPEKKNIKNFHNLAANWEESGGLTQTGVEIVEVMLELGMIIDVTHMTLEGRKEVYDIVDAHDIDHAVMASHVGASEVHRLSYNLQDWELKWMADRGCCAGIIFMNYWLTPHHHKGNGLKYIEQTLNHVVNVAGADVPAIGSDFDGFTDPPDELTTVDDFPLVAKHLLDMGYDEITMKNFIGGNAMNLLTNGWGKDEEDTI